MYEYLIDKRASKVYETLSGVLIICMDVLVQP